MKVVTFSEHLYGIGLLTKALIYPGTLLEAHKPYLLSLHQYNALCNESSNTFMRQISDAWPLLRELHVEAEGKGRDVLLYNDVGGMGDMVMMWPLAQILHKRGYKVHILLRPGYEHLWVGFPWIESVIILPTHWNTIQRFHGHVFFEFLTNYYMHQDQGHPLDIMLQKVGIDPNEIPDSEKRVIPNFTFWENEMGRNLYKGKKLAFFQLSASQHSRSLSPEQTRNLLLSLAKAFPELHWIGLYGLKIAPAYYVPALSEPNVEFRMFEKIRILWSLLRRAEVCIGPDSMLIHAAGTQGIPCVGLWGTHDPSTRVKYYPKHFPIFLSEKCAQSPCYWLASTMPTFCPDEIPDRRYCGVLQAITEEMVIAKVREALSSKA